MMTPCPTPAPGRRSANAACRLAALGAVAAGLSLLLLTGTLAWSVVRGMPGVLMTAALAAGASLLFRGAGCWGARLAGALIGGFFAGYAAISYAEAARPGTFEWFWRAGLYGLLWGVPPCLAATFAVQWMGRSRFYPQSAAEKRR